MIVSQSTYDAIDIAIERIKQERREGNDDKNLQRILLHLLTLASGMTKEVQPTWTPDGAA